MNNDLDEFFLGLREGEKIEYDDGQGRYGAEILCWWGLHYWALVLDKGAVYKFDLDSLSRENGIKYFKRFERMWSLREISQHWGAKKDKVINSFFKDAELAQDKKEKY